MMELGPIILRDLLWWLVECDLAQLSLHDHHTPWRQYRRVSVVTTVESGDVGRQLLGSCHNYIQVTDYRKLRWHLEGLHLEKDMRGIRAFCYQMRASAR